MTATRDPDRILRAWLELMPSEAPDRAIAAVLQATEAAPQVRPEPRLGPWRLPMNRLSMIAAAAVIATAVIGGTFLLAVGRPGPTSQTAAPSSPAITGATVPAELVAGWYGPERPVPGIAPAAGTVLFFDARELRIGQSDQRRATLGRSTVSVVGDSIRVEAATPSLGCLAGDVGLYGAELSESGRALTLAVASEACAARAAVLEGTWWKQACWNAGACYGELDAGTYATQFFDPRIDPGAASAANYGGLTFTVPDGWALALDTSDRARLTPDYAGEIANGGIPTGLNGDLFVLAQPFPAVDGAACVSSATPSLGDGRTPADIVAFLRGESWIDVGSVTELVIDGHAAISLRMAIRAGSNPGCPGDTHPYGTLLTSYTESWAIGLTGEQHANLVLVDLGAGDVVAIVLVGRDAPALEELVAVELPVVQSFRFE